MLINNSNIITSGGKTVLEEEENEGYGEEESSTCVASSGEIDSKTSVFINNNSIISGNMTVEENCVIEISSSEVEGEMREKMDSGSGLSLSNNKMRLANLREPRGDEVKKCVGFNGHSSFSGMIGTNIDGFEEHQIDDMPDNLALLAASQYASMGAVVLFPDAGFVITGNAEERKKFRKMTESQSVYLKLNVVRGTYEVSRGKDSKVIERKEDEDDGFEEDDEESCGGITYFNDLNGRNGKVEVASVFDRILTLLLCGWSMKDLKSAVKFKSILGIHPSVSKIALDEFIKLNGSTLNIVSLALGRNQANVRAFQEDQKKIDKVGYMQMDFAEFDFLEELKVGEKKRKKLATYGGGLFMAIWVDQHSGFPQGKILKSTADAIEVVKYAVQGFRKDNHVVHEFSADTGINSASVWKVLDPKVEEYLREERIKMRRSEPSNHANGTSMVEALIGIIKNLMRFAFQYMFGNNVIKKLEFFHEEDILPLWGEIFAWAITMSGLKPHRSLVGETKFSVYHLGVKPNMQELRILPIGCIVLVLMKNSVGRKPGNGVKDFYRQALYVGPDKQVKGGIRTVFKTGENKPVQLIVTTKFKDVSQGDGRDLSGNERRGLKDLVEEKRKEIDSEKTIVPLIIQNKSNNIVSNAKKEEEKQEKQEILLKNSNIMLSPIEEKEEEKEGKEEENIDNNNIKESNNEDFEEVVSKSEKKKEKKKERGLQRISDEQLKAMREERAKKRRDGEIEAFSVDWGDIVNTKPEEAIQDLWSFEDNCVVTIVNQPEMKDIDAFHVYNTISQRYADKKDDIDAFSIVTVNTPKTFQEALSSAKWGDAARKELAIQSDTKCLVGIHSAAANKAIQEGADVVVLFPIYEEKIKLGIKVYKVRLVGNGSHHKVNNEDTYAPTPSREEMLMLLHLIAHRDWNFYLADEIRAFLTARKTGTKRVIARMRGDGRFWEVLGALYGLKTSPKDYNISLVLRMIEKLGFKPFKLSRCIFYRESNRGIIFVYHFVDDFLITGSCKEEVEDFLLEFKNYFNITEPESDPKKVLGIELYRVRTEHIICLSMEQKIVELCESVGDVVTMSRERMVPITTRGAIVDVEELIEEAAVCLKLSEVETFMEIVGSVIWISGIRFDIKFAVVYLTWFTKDPRKHHMNVAIYLLQYLWHTKSLVLVLGGKKKMTATSFCDSSYGKGKFGRSISANIVKLNEDSGAISAKVSATGTVSLSSFEAELEARSTGAKALMFAEHLMEEFKIEEREIPIQWNDNLALKLFLEGNGSAKGIRHIELRMFYLRELGAMGKIIFKHMKGKSLPPDGITKAKSRKDFAINRSDMMGHKLLEFMNENS